MGKTLKPSTSKNVIARETKEFREILRKNKQVVPEGKPLEPGVTHVEKTDDKGNRVLVRKRYSAI